jgi:hypothetical protein
MGDQHWGATKQTSLGTMEVGTMDVPSRRSGRVAGSNKSTQRPATSTALQTKHTYETFGDEFGRGDTASRGVS